MLLERVDIELVKILSLVAMFFRSLVIFFYNRNKVYRIVIIYFVPCPFVCIEFTAVYNNYKALVIIEVFRSDINTFKHYSVAGS